MIAWLSLMFYMLEEAITILFKLFGKTIDLIEANRFSTCLLWFIGGIILLAIILV